MENESDYIVYELKKINKLPLWIFLFIILAVTCVCKLFVYAVFHRKARYSCNTCNHYS